MLAQQALLPLKLSPSVVVAPPSSTLSRERFSPAPEFGGVPISNIPGDAEQVLLRGRRAQNPALLTSNSPWSVHPDNTLRFRSHPLVSIRHALSQIQEEEVCTSHGSKRHTLSPSIVTKSRVAKHFDSAPAVSTSISRENFHQGRYVRPCVNRLTAHSLFPHSNPTLPQMIVTVSVPGTPPELTESQSSKSSSYGSRTSSPPEFAGRNMNFEEIDLDDGQHPSPPRPVLPRSDSRENIKRQHSLAIRPALATLQTQENRHLRSSGNGAKSAATPTTKRYFSSPTIPAIGSKSTTRTRSESPVLTKAPASSRLAQFAHTPATSLAIPGRRCSWQPARRTIYEIEAEYHDSDDELPDDASLFNVPCSPFPSHPRSAPRSAVSSARGSPERESGVVSPAPIPLGHARTAPDVVSKLRSGQKSSSRQKLASRTASTGLVQSKSASSSPRTDRFARTKSWNLVMADLDHEARIVAEKLDFHEEVSSKAASASANSYRISAPGAIPLPPIQRGTLDFMPISKEKEAVLSRTRPSWLPPKDPREEKKHLLEYQRMMKASIEADKKREDRITTTHSTNESTRESLRRIWTYYVNPTTDLNAIDRRVNDLCWRGIPSSLRGSVWQRAVGNPLGLGQDDFVLATKRVQEIKSRPAEETTEHEKKMQRWFVDIERDAETAFPETSIFLRDGPQHKDLIDVCEAYAFHRADTGYVYGIQLIAALVLLQVPDPSEAFILLANCLSRTLPIAFQSSDTEATTRTYSKVKSTLDIKFPRLHSYLFNDEEQGGLGFIGEELFETMFRTLFTNGLDLERLCRVWDIWVFESDRYLVRTAVALLGAMETQILDIQGDIHLRRRNIQEMLGWGPFNRSEAGYWKLDAPGNGDTFVDEIRAAGKLDTAGK